MPSQTRQHPGRPVKVVVQRVLEAELDHMVDLDVLVEVLELLLPDLASVLLKEKVLGWKRSIFSIFVLVVQ
eukprot:5820872-Prorocentrum_lima.AAC.1